LHFNISHPVQTIHQFYFITCFRGFIICFRGRWRKEGRILKVYLFYILKYQFKQCIMKQRVSVHWNKKKWKILSIIQTVFYKLLSCQNLELTGRSEITWLIALQAAAVAPVWTAFMDTSMRKKYTAGIGSRTYRKQWLTPVITDTKWRNKNKRKIGLVPGRSINCLVYY